MSRRRKLTEEQEDELFRMVRHGSYSNKELGKRFGIAPSTVRTYYNRAMARRGRDAAEKGGERVVAVRTNARLTFSVEGGYVAVYDYGGTQDACRIEAQDDDSAIKSFREWVDYMREEERALDEIVRDASADECAQLRAKVEDLEAEVALRDRRLAEAGEATPAAPLPPAVYAVMALRPEVRPYAYHVSADEALQAVEHLNAVGRALGVEDAFDVFELPLAGGGAA